MPLCMHKLYFVCFDGACLIPISFTSFSPIPSNSIVYRISLQRPPRILNAEMFSTPPKLLNLPSYARDLAQVFAEAPSLVPICT